MLEVDIRRSLGSFQLEAAFVAPAPGVTVLFGPSGAGKSATLAAIAGTATDAQGSIVLDGEALLSSAKGIRVPAARRQLGVVHQHARLFPHMPVRDNLLYGWRRVQRERPIALDCVAAVLGLESLLDRRPAALSGGERQRVALGRALLAQPRMLLLDEPLAALDAERKAEALAYLVELKRNFGVQMLLVTHDRAEANALGDHVVMIAGGRTRSAAPITLLALPLDVEAVVIAHDPVDGSTVVEAVGRQWRVPRVNAPIAARLRLSASGLAPGITPPA